MNRKGAAFGLHLFFYGVSCYLCNMMVRRLLSLVLLPLLSVPLFAQTKTAMPEPGIVFHTQKIDIGDTLYQKEAVFEYDFVYENPGTAPLIINKVIATCPCIRVELPDQPLAPGGVDTLRVYFTPNHASKFTQRLSVFTNSPRNGIQLFAKGNFLKPAEWEARKGTALAP